MRCIFCVRRCGSWTCIRNSSQYNEGECPFGGDYDRCADHNAKRQVTFMNNWSILTTLYEESGEGCRAAAV